MIIAVAKAREAGYEGIVLAVLIFVVALQLRRIATSTQRSMFATRSYRATVAIEVLALGVGTALLSSTHRTEYNIAWTAAVVGLHFLIFGRLFAARFHLLGAALLAAAIIGAVINVSGGSQDHATAATGLIAAASLLLAAGVTLMKRPIRFRACADHLTPARSAVRLSESGPLAEPDRARHPISRTAECARAV